MRRIIFLVTAISLFGCSTSRKVNYDNVHASLPAVNQKISLATWDRKEQVVSGSRKPDFIAYTRSSVGIAHPMGTTSGKPLADLLSNNISSSLSSKGSSTSVVSTNTGQTESTILTNLKKQIKVD